MATSTLTPLSHRHIEGEVISSPLRNLGSPHKEKNTTSDRMQELEQMLNEAQGRSELLEREAYDKAYEAGEKTGMELGRKRAEQIVDAMAAHLKQCERSSRRLHEKMDEVILDIAESVVRQIVDNMLEEHPEYLKHMIGQATRFIPKQESFKLAVSIQDMAMFEGMLGDTPNEMLADDNIKPGTCRIMASDHDVLIDPEAAINECMQHIRGKLMLKSAEQPEAAEAGTTDT